MICGAPPNKNPRPLLNPGGRELGPEIAPGGAEAAGALRGAPEELRAGEGAVSLVCVTRSAVYKRGWGLWGCGAGGVGWVKARSRSCHPLYLWGMVILLLPQTCCAGAFCLFLFL